MTTPIMTAETEIIPEDVMRTAFDEALKYVEWLAPAPTDSDAEHVLAASFVRVLLAERERCAKAAAEFARVSDLHNYGPGGLTRLEAERQSTAMEIAYAIRNPTP